MTERLALDLHAQPDDLTCGPTCLHALYRYYGLELPLETVINETPRLDDGGTLAVHLGRHALRRGFRARMYVFNLKLFDPTWFPPVRPATGGPGAGSAAPPPMARLRSMRGVADPAALAAKLRSQRPTRTRPKVRLAIDAYLDYLALGGEVAMEDLTSELLRRYLVRDIPILTGLSATWLYGCAREIEGDPGRLLHDDVRGDPTGHFVILGGYDRAAREVFVEDPLLPDAPSAQVHRRGRSYAVDIDHLVCAILIGIITYDGNLLVVQPPQADPPRTAAPASHPPTAPHCR
ncbi:MAG TPA: hypothetical protein PKC43_13485 [Phycisphaerales bacterium]|nr:hypothetical protein [Phycisphaerales bacterium]HMP38445.1 hypothetical protein [Phycisphaerales bacterium]